jgi:hypothetical protein
VRDRASDDRHRLRTVGSVLACAASGAALAVVGRTALQRRRLGESRGAPPRQPATQAEPSRARLSLSEEACPPAESAVERRAAAVLLAAIAVIVIATVIPAHPVDIWIARAALVCWALAGLTFGIALASRLRIRVDLGRRVKHAWSAGVAKRSDLARVIALLPAKCVETWAAWPFLVLMGPVLVAGGVGILSERAWLVGVTVAVASGPLAYAVKSFIHDVRVINADVSLLQLFLGTVVWMVAAAAIAATYEWPSPSTGFFGTAAQVNATLLVAGVINAAPAAWRTSKRLVLTWILTAPTVAIVGLSASIAGSISATGHRGLFVLSIAPLAPIVLALVAGAYNAVHGAPARQEVSDTTGAPARHKAHSRARSGGRRA